MRGSPDFDASPRLKRENGNASMPSDAGPFGKLRSLPAKSWIDRLRTRYYVRTAQSLCAAARLDEAEVLLAKAAKRFPNDRNVLIGLASITRDRGNHALALQRWEEVGRLFPDHPEWVLGVSSALLNLNRAEEAERILAEATRCFPEDPNIAVERGISLYELWRFADAEKVLAIAVLQRPNHKKAAKYFASLATHRRDWSEALKRWQAAREKFAGDNEVVYGEAEAKYGIWMDHDPAPASDLGGSNSGGECAPASIQDRLDSPGEVRNPHSELMFKFESLGCNCDLGRVQRYYGSEPLGLLRFVSIAPKSLITALQERFKAVGTPESTKLTVRNFLGREYFLTDKTYNFRMHTFIYVDHIDDKTRLKALFDKHCCRLKFLKEKLITDLKNAEKIFVFRSVGSMTTAEMKELYCEIRRYGPNTLLCVREDNARPPGSVDIIEQGLMAAYLEPIVPRTLMVPNDTWLRICTSAENIWQNWSN
jgi:Flp pilus assembly protein TadD